MHEITLNMQGPESFFGVCTCSEKSLETSRNNILVWAAFHLALVGVIKMEESQAA